MQKLLLLDCKYKASLCLQSGKTFSSKFYVSNIFIGKMKLIQLIYYMAV